MKKLKMNEPAKHKLVDKDRNKKDRKNEKISVLIKFLYTSFEKDFANR